MLLSPIAIQNPAIHEQQWNVLLADPHAKRLVEFQDFLVQRLLKEVECAYERLAALKFVIAAGSARLRDTSIQI